MVMSWVNGLYICDSCGDEFVSSELTSAFGGMEIDYVEVPPGCYKRVECPYSVSLCADCLRGVEQGTRASDKEVRRCVDGL